MLYFQFYSQCLDIPKKHCLSWQKFEWGLKLLLKIQNPLKSKLLPIYDIIRDKDDKDDAVDRRKLGF